MYYLLTKRCVSEKHSRRLEVIEDAFVGKITDVESVLAGLMKRGYVERKKKKSCNYWIVLGPALRALGAHDYRIPRGGRIPL